MRAILSPGALAVLLFAGCSGQLFTPAGPLGGDRSDSRAGGSSPTEFTCNEGAGSVASPLKRLSRDQYRNSVRDLIAGSLAAADADAVWNEISASFESVPIDVVNDAAPFAGMDSNVSQSHVDTYFSIGERTARALTSSSERVSALLACAAGQADLECVNAFIGRFARRAFRHDLSEAELAFLTESYGNLVLDAASLADVITVILNMPEFLYHLELGKEAIAGQANAVKLDDYELAARISYQFWQTLPDDTLLEMAQKGELSTDDGFEAALDHALSDPRARASVELFVREWFDIEKMRSLDALNGTPVFDAFVGDDVPSPDLREDMIQEVLDSFVWHMERDDSFNDWFASPYSFAKSAELAHIYGVGVWDGASEPPRFPEGQRAGLITRAGLLATGSANTRPIIKGVFLRKRMMCDELSPPPAAAAMVKIELSDNLTTREVVEQITETNQPCASCHQGLINGLGFPTENYDALGRLRSTQRLFSSDGHVVAEKPINTDSIPNILGGPEDDAAHVANASELVESLLDSGKLEACFSRQYLRFTFARKDDLNLDGCALEDVRTALVKGQGMKTAMRALALRPEFRQRVIGEEQP
jgi:hypothetical protein